MYEVFAQGKRAESTSRWVPLYGHHVSAAGAPGAPKLDRWMTQQGVTDVVTLQRVDEMSTWLQEAHAAGDEMWHHFGLSGKKLEGPADEESLARVLEWTRALGALGGEPRRIVVHCSAGLHRTGIVLYLMWRASGLEHEQAIDAVGHARQLTGEELVRRPRRAEPLAQVARGVFERWVASLPQEV